MPPTYSTLDEDGNIIQKEFEEGVCVDSKVANPESYRLEGQSLEKMEEVQAEAEIKPKVEEKAAEKKK